MKRHTILRLVTTITIIAYACVIVGWHVYEPRRDIGLQLPGADNRPAGATRKADEVHIGEFFMRYAEPLTTAGGEWKGFRGLLRNNIVQAAGANITPEATYTECWTVTTGEGHAAAAISNGQVYFLDYDETLSSDMLRCLSLETGKELWRRWYRVPLKRNHGFSRTVPAISGDQVITLGPQGHLMSCNRLSGDMTWFVDMVQTYKTQVPFWYTGQCPLVDDDILVLAPAGEEVLLTGIDCRTGDTVWSTPNTIGLKMSHSSVMLMKLGGQPTYVYAGIGGVCGISAGANNTGTLLWHTSEWQPNVIAPSPLQLSGDRILLTAGYGSGGALLQVTRAGDKWTAKITEQYKPNAGLSSEQQTPIFYHDAIITIMPKDGGSLRDRLVMFSPDDLHHAIWTSGADERFGLGPYLILNDYLLALKDDGELYTYQLHDNSMTLLKKQRIMEGVDAWGPMAYADGRLIVRDAHHLKCLELH